MSNVAAGKDTDDEGEALNDVEKVLNKLDIKLRDSVGEWRNFEDVLDEVADKWKNFAEVERSQIATAIAGTRQQETFRALMNNYDEVIKLTDVAANSSGAAAKKMEIYLDSVEAKTNELKATWEEFVMSLNQSESYKDFLDLCIWLLNNLPTIIGLISSLIIVIKGATILKGVKDLITSFGGLKERILGLKGDISLLSSVWGKNTKIMYTNITAQQIEAAALNTVSFAIGAVIAAVTVAITLYNNWKQANMEAAQTARKEADSYEEKVKAMEDAIDKYKEIYDSTDDYSTKQENLKTLSNDLTTAYGKEAEALDLLNGKYEDNITAMQKAANEKRKKEKDSLAVSAQKGESNLNNWTNSYWNTDYKLSDSNKYVDKDSQFVKDIQEIIKGDGKNTGGYFLTNFMGDKYKGLRMRNETTNEQNLKYAQDLQEYYDEHFNDLKEGERELLQGFISQIKQEVDSDASGQFENKQKYQLAKVTQNDDGSMKQEIVDYETQLKKQQDLQKKYDEETDKDKKENLKQQLANQYTETEKALEKVKSLYNSGDENQSTLSEKVILNYLGFGEDNTPKVQSNIYAGLTEDQKKTYEDIKKEIKDTGKLSDESKKKLAELKQQISQKEDGNNWIAALNEDLDGIANQSKINLQKDSLLNEFNSIEDKTYENIGRWLNGVNASLTDLGVNVDAKWYKDLSEGLKNGTTDFETFYNTVSEKCKILGIDLEDLAKSIDKNAESIKILGSQQDFIDEVDAIDELYSDAANIKSGKSLDNDRIVELRNEHKELNDYIAETGDLTFQNGKMLADIANNTYEEGTKAIENQISALDDYQDAILNTVDALGLMSEFEEELAKIDKELSDTIDEESVKQANAKGKFADISKETADGVYNANEIIQDSEGKTYTINQAIAQGIMDTEDEKVKAKINAAQESMKALWEEAQVTEDTSIISADYIEQNKQALLDKGWTEEQITNAKTQLAGIQIDADGNISSAAQTQAKTTEDAQLATAKAFTSVTLAAISTAKSIASLFGIESAALNQAETDLKSAQDTINSVEEGKEERAKNAAKAYAEIEARKKELEARKNQYGYNNKTGQGNYNSAKKSGSGSKNNYSAEDAASDLKDILNDIEDYEADIELDLEDQTEELINHYNLERNKLDTLKEELDYYDSIYDVTENTTKWLDTQLKILDEESKKVAEIQNANDKIDKQRQKIYNENSSLNVQSWFDSEGNETLAYGDLLNSFEYRKNQIEKETAAAMRAEYDKVANSTDKDTISAAKDRIKQIEKEGDIKIKQIDKERDYVENVYDSVSQLNDAWKDNQEAIREALQELNDRVKSIRDELIDDIMEQLERAVDKMNTSIEKDVTRLEQLKQVQESYNDILNDTIDTQQELEDELKANMDSYQYLDDTMRQLMFNEDDYKQLSGVIERIQSDIANIWEDHYNQIQNLTEDEMYKAEYITNETERQLAAKQKEYDLAKAELDVAKAQTNLNNVKNERNTRIFANGEWQWVANPDDVKSAQQQLMEAEREKTRLEREAEQQLLIDKMDKMIDSDNLQIDKNNELLEKIQDAIEKETEEVKSIEEALLNADKANLPALTTTLIGALGSDGGYMKELLGEINHSQVELAAALRGQTVQQAIDQLKSGTMSQSDFEELTKRLGFSFNPTTGMVTTQDGSFAAHYKGWVKKSNSDTQLGTAANGVQVTGGQAGSGQANAATSGGNGGGSSFPRNGRVTTSSLPLRIRSGAGTQYKILGTMPKGANVTILGEANSGWAQVKYGSITGYASRQYLSYDQGGIASGIGYMPKATLEPERVLSPRQTKAFEKLVNNITTNPVLNALSRIPSVNSKLGNLAGETNNSKNYYFSNFTVQADDIKQFINSIETIMPMKNK